MSGVGVHLGVGSNIDAAINVKKALTLLEEHLGPLQQSPIYQNPSEGFDGDDFLNLVVSFECSMDLPELIKLLKSIEQQCGRLRQLESGKGSRTIDLDLLTFGELSGVHHGIELPRPDIFNRQFVWQPLLDLYKSKTCLSDFEHEIRLKIEASVELQNSVSMLKIQG